MARCTRFRIPTLVLVLALVTLPAFATERPARQAEAGFLRALVRAIATLVPAAAGLTDWLSEAGGPAAPEDPEEPGADDDLGPGLDPLG